MWYASTYLYLQEIHLLSMYSTIPLHTPIHPFHATCVRTHRVVSTYTAYVFLQEIHLISTRYVDTVRTIQPFRATCLWRALALQSVAEFNDTQIVEVYCCQLLVRMYVSLFGWYVNTSSSICIFYNTLSEHSQNFVCREWMHNVLYQNNEPRE